MFESTRSSQINFKNPQSKLRQERSQTYEDQQNIVGRYNNDYSSTMRQTMRISEEQQQEMQRSMLFNQMEKIETGMDPKHIQFEFQVATTAREQPTINTA